jgi:hypothetical protein
MSLERTLHHDEGIEGYSRKFEVSDTRASSCRDLCCWDERHGGLDEG